MKKQSISFTPLIVLICLCLVAALSSCKKYDDGPRLSLRTKKSRIANEWQYKKVTAPNGVDMTSQYVDNYIEFQKDGSYIDTDGTYSSTGTWQFASDKEDLVLTESGSGDAYTYHIIRLKNKEFWFTLANQFGTYEFRLEPR